MKRRMLCIVGLMLVFCVLFTGCSPAFDVASEPVADDASQEFNTPNKFLPITLPTKSGGTCEAAVKAEITYDLDNEEALMKEILEDENNVVRKTTGLEADQMRLVKIRLLVMPWGETDFTKDFPELTVFFGGRGQEGLFGVTTGPDEDPDHPGQALVKSGTPLDYSKLFREHTERFGINILEEESEPQYGWCPFSYHYSATTLIESDRPYFETGAYALIPKAESASDDCEILVAVIGEGYNRMFVTKELDDVPSEGKLFWKVA